MPNIMSLGVSFKKLHLVKVGGFLLDTASKFALFSLRYPVLKEEQTYTKTEHANFILEYFEYFCQMSSKSICIILSYTVSKLTRFLRHTVH